MKLSIPLVLLGGLSSCVSSGGPFAYGEGAGDLPERASDQGVQKQAEKPVNWSDGLDLEEALTLAFAQNPRFRVNRYEMDLSRARRVTAGTYPYNPEIKLDGGRVAPFSQPEDYSARVGISQAFEIAGQRGHRISIAEANIEKSRWVVADAERRLRAETTAAFYELLFLQRRRDIALQNAELAGRFQDASEARFSAKQIPEIEVNLARLERQKAEAERERALRELGGARARLAALLGEPERGEYEARGDLAVALAIVDVNRLVGAAAERRPDLRALRAEERAARERIELAEASVWPDPVLGIFAGYDVSRFPLNTGEGVDRDPGLGLELSFSLPVLNRRRGEIQEAGVELRRTRAEIGGVLQEIRRDVELGVNRLALAKSILDIYEKDLNRLSRQNLEDVERAYRAGEVGALEFLRAQENFNRASLAYLEAQFELRAALVELESAAGAKLSEIP